MLLKLIEWYAKRKGRQAAKKFRNDPVVKKDLKELELHWSEFEIRSKKLSADIDEYLNENNDFE
ncbi:MAG: hypothetical protein WC121_08490 [Candidatus Kapaibacterium sp.]